LNSHDCADNRKEQNGSVEQKRDPSRISCGKLMEGKRQKDHQGKQQQTVRRTANKGRVPVDLARNDAADKGGDRRRQKCERTDQRIGIGKKVSAEGKEKERACSHGKRDQKCFQRFLREAILPNRL